MMVVSLYPRSVPWVVKTLFRGGQSIRLSVKCEDEEGKKKRNPWGISGAGGRSGGEHQHVFRSIFVGVLAQEPTKIACTEHLGWTAQSKPRGGARWIDSSCLGTFPNTSLSEIVNSHSPLSSYQMVGSMRIRFNLAFQLLVKMSIGSVFRFL